VHIQIIFAYSYFICISPCLEIRSELKHLISTICLYFSMVYNSQRLLLTDPKHFVQQQLYLKPLGSPQISSESSCKKIIIHIRFCNRQIPRAVLLRILYKMDVSPRNVSLCIILSVIKPFNGHTHITQSTFEHPPDNT